MGAWWRGTQLVAGRTVTEYARSRSLWAITGVLLLLSTAAVLLPQLLGGEDTEVTLVTVGDAPGELVAALDGAAEASGLTVAYASAPDEEGVRAAIRDGEADAGLAGDTLYVEERADSTFPVLVSQVVVRLEVAGRLSDAGLSPEQIGEVFSVAPPTQEAVGRTEDSDRAGLGFLVGVVLYLAVTFAGSTISTNVANEKASHLSEVLLAVLRPTQVMVGTVVAVAAVAIVQLLVLALPPIIGVTVGDSIDLPATAAADIALGLLWFVLGFALYGFLFAASGAMVSKVSEASSTAMPIQFLLLGGYLVGIIGATEDSQSALSTVASIFPFSAPLVMPIRWASGATPVWQLVVAYLLTAATAVVLAKVAAGAYRRSLLITSHRASFREALGLRESAP